MFRTLLKEQFGIEAEDTMRIGKYDACRIQGQLYLLVPAGHTDEEELEELDQMAEHLSNNGDRNISTFLKTKEGKQSIDWNDSRFCILVNRHTLSRKQNQFGRKLAKFHYRGRSISFPVKKTSRIGQWKQLWEQRLDQMEKVWNEMLFQKPENDFERMFLESFPYYMGLAENSIQYLVDTELDDEPEMADSGTVCHIRLTSATWGDSYYMKNPFDWVFDHSSRDLAEWTREKYFHNIKTYQPDLRQFLSEYQSVVPLSSFSWRLYYARLLFPLHYFETVENYYGADSEQQKLVLQERLQKYLWQSDDHERFLGGFFEFAEVPIKKLRIPLVNWIKS
ncbi:spore coat protein YutH [Cytobacillus oceanisediminis]|uniref:spore coat putative kinase YutH n=1 Tax=Cytobacillus oceanisediminis TaxID=665099 RepID=UPI0023DB71B0|nr:spore coat protein YutH [Cytobacillus oceanisediminis]MDF2037447.1 spore coat protein YutH [Cytobacillus oceanisediminis]